MHVLVCVCLCVRACVYVRAWMRVLCVCARARVCVSVCSVCFRGEISIPQIPPYNKILRYIINYTLGKISPSIFASPHPQYCYLRINTVCVCGYYQS